MISKNGFLLIELMIGLTLFLFFIFIIAHYIIQLKNIQLAGIRRIEALSLARNNAEKFYARQAIDTTILDTPGYVVKVTTKPLSSIFNGQNIHPVPVVATITVSWDTNKHTHHLVLDTIIQGNSSDH